nr:phosphonate ABC transporter, permease protein PhnE [Paracoccaceae bacterium]
MTATLMAPTLAETVTRRFQKRRLWSLLIPLGVLAYLAYAALAFDVAGLASRARMDNAAILLGDFWSHKVHVG